MFENINKNQYTQSQQNSAKRHNFRVQIRRKAVQSYQKRIRTQWSQELGRTNSLSIKQQYQQPLNINQSQQSQITIANRQSMSQQTIQILQKLQQLSLTQGSQLCRLETLQELISILNKTKNFIPISELISKILIKICISEIYWSQQFIGLLFFVIIKVHKFGFDCSQFLINLSECAQLDMKAVLYGVMLGSGILEEQVYTFYHRNLNTQKYFKLRTLRILSNFLLVAPIVSHTHPFLTKSKTPTNYFLQKLLQLLLTVLHETQNRSANSHSIQKRLINKQHYDMLQLFYGICSRLESRELSFILPLLKNNSWQIFQLLTKKFGIQYYLIKQGKQESEGEEYSKPMDVKIKFKIMQCVQTILRFCISQQNSKQTGLQFFYLFLPTILNIISQDIPTYIPSSSYCSLQKSSPEYYTIKFDQKYQYLLLQVIYTLLNVRDRQNQVPVLDYVSVTYPALFSNVFRYFGKYQPQLKKIKLLVWIFQILNNQVHCICQLAWATQFVQDVILCNGTAQMSESILISVLETVEYILINEDHEGFNCRIFNTMNNASIITKLQSFLDTDKLINPNIINSVDNILSILGKRDSN